jgi:hypothetical protein
MYAARLSRHGGRGHARGGGLGQVQHAVQGPARGVGFVGEVGLGRRAGDVGGVATGEGEGGAGEVGPRRGFAGVGEEYAAALISTSTSDQWCAATARHR